MTSQDIIIILLDAPHFSKTSDIWLKLNSSLPTSNIILRRVHIHGVSHSCSPEAEAPRAPKPPQYSVHAMSHRLERSREFVWGSFLRANLGSLGGSPHIIYITLSDASNGVKGLAVDIISPRIRGLALPAKIDSSADH